MDEQIESIVNGISAPPSLTEVIEQAQAQALLVLLRAMRSSDSDTQFVAATEILRWTSTVQHGR